MYLRYNRLVNRLKLIWGLLFVLGFLPIPANSQENDSVERIAESGQSALAAGRYVDAEKAFERLRELEPKNR